MNIILLLLQSLFMSNLFQPFITLNTNQEVGMGLKTLVYVNINNELYFTHDKPIRNNTIQIKQIRDTTVVIDLKVPKLELYYALESYRIKHIFYGDGNLFVFLDSYIIQYDQNKSFSLKKIFNLKDIFSNKHYVSASHNIYFQDNKIIGMYDFYDAYDIEDEDYYFWWIDITNEEKNDFISLKAPTAFFYTIFQPRSIIDYSNKRILTSEILEYKTYIRDMKGNIQDSIYRNISDWEKPQIPEHLKSKDPWLIISQIQSDTTKISLIHRADFLTDNKILITYSMENRRPENDFYIYHLYFDIWEEIDNQWTLVEKDVSINSLQRNDYTKPDVFFGMDYEISNGFFIFPYYNRDTYSDFKIIVRKIK